jgi:hypothetical protein
LSVGDIRRGGIGRGYSEGTYMHLGRKAEIRMASDTPSPFQLKSISVIVVVIVTACLSPKVKLDIAPMSLMAPAIAAGPTNITKNKNSGTAIEQKLYLLE